MKKNKADFLKSIQIELKKNSNVVFAYAYGSYLNRTDARDIDIAVYLKHHHDSLEESSEIASKLEKTFNYRMPVDVHMLNSASLSFAFHVIAKGKLFLDKRRALRIPWEAHLMSRYQDFKPILDFHDRQFLSRQTMRKEVLNHLRDLEENLNDWQGYLQIISQDVFLEDRKSRHQLQYPVLVALQAAIDIANHWVAELTAERPESYRAIADLLAQKKAISQDLAKKLKGLFALRNVLIHKYQELDLNKLYQHLQDGIEPLKGFLSLAKSKVSL